jgi:hypothetical protein
MYMHAQARGTLANNHLLCSPQVSVLRARQHLWVVAHGMPGNNSIRLLTLSLSLPASATGVSTGSGTTGPAAAGWCTGNRPNQALSSLLTGRSKPCWVTPLGQQHPKSQVCLVERGPKDGPTCLKLFACGSVCLSRRTSKRRHASVKTAMSAQRQYLVRALTVPKSGVKEPGQAV